jgi:mycofactocin system creatininase family protein
VIVGTELGECTYSQLDGTAPVLMVPVGSTEQHGPHLPLDTDTRIATAVAGSVATRLGHLLAPAIPYGASGEHQSFPGTISIGTAALTAVLTEYARSACEWAPRLVFVNGHGGNLDALRSATATLRREGRDAGWVSVGRTAPGDSAADFHAGHTETSLLLHLSPQAVRRERCVRGNTAPLAELMPALRSGGVAAVSPSGVLGDPTTATAAAGSRIFADMVADCLGRIRQWRPGPDGMLG